VTAVDRRLEDITQQIIAMLVVARVCKDEDIMLSIARLRDAMNRSDLSGSTADEHNAMRARHDALERLLQERKEGRNRRRWWSGTGFSDYEGTAWAVERLSGLQG